MLSFITSLVCFLIWSVFILRKIPLLLLARMLFKDTKNQPETDDEFRITLKLLEQNSFLRDKFWQQAKPILTIIYFVDTIQLLIAGRMFIHIILLTGKIFWPIIFFITLNCLVFAENLVILICIKLFVSGKSRILVQSMHILSKLAEESDLTSEEISIENLDKLKNDLENLKNIPDFKISSLLDEDFVTDLVKRIDIQNKIWDIEDALKKEKSRKKPQD